MTAMFINCPHCRALVATDPATDLPPEHCPRCVLRLREPVEEDEPPAAAPTAPVAEAPRVDAPRMDAPRVNTRRGEGPDATDAPSPATVASTAAPAAQLAATGARSDAGATGPVATDAAARDAVATERVAGAPRNDDDGAKARVDTSLDDAPAGAPTDAEDAAHEVAAVSVPAASRTGHAPSFAARRMPATDPSASRRTRWILPAACAALAVLLGLQWLLADRARLAGEARWRPLVVAACDVFGCSVPAWHEPSALVLVSRDVRPHPGQPGALRVQAVLRNDARWTQAWPEIVLTLSDVDGRAVASRAFTADEYLPARTSSGLESGQTASLRFDVVEPATPVVAFGFDFR